MCLCMLGIKIVFASWLYLFVCVGLLENNAFTFQCFIVDGNLIMIEMQLLNL